jgi:sec-independent protein translocase protein TatB
VFNIQGSELVFLLLIALIVLGPEKLPDAIRKFGRAYSEFKKMANGFQGELKQALDEPMRELRDTADAMRSAANFDLDGVINPGATPASPAAAESAPSAAPPVQREQGLNFGSANPRRQERTASATETDPAPTADDTPPPVVREPGLNFGSANPRRGPASVNDVQPVVQPVVQPLDDVGPAATSSPDRSATLNRDPPTAEGDAAE